VGIVERLGRRDPQARSRQQDPAWRADYRATRPKVERKLAHMLRAGRHARRRGRAKVDADWNYLGAGINYARMARLGAAQHRRKLADRPRLTAHRDDPAGPGLQPAFDSCSCV
jgi:hypothetical protein